jgi:hypothetical protein
LVGRELDKEVVEENVDEDEIQELREALYEIEQVYHTILEVREKGARASRKKFLEKLEELQDRLGTAIDIIEFLIE